MKTLTLPPASRQGLDRPTQAERPKNSSDFEFAFERYSRMKSDMEDSSIRSAARAGLWMFRTATRSAVRES